MGEPALGQLGSRFSQARGKRLLEKKGRRGSTHPLTVSNLKRGLWNEHQRTPFGSPCWTSLLSPAPVSDLLCTSPHIPPPPYSHPIHSP